MDVSINCAWVPVGEIAPTSEGTLTWPRMPNGAGVYRFVLRLDGRTRIYVGETDGYRRRFAHYANPGPSQSTNIKMKARLLKLLVDHRGTAHVEIASEVRLVIDGAPCDASPLPDVFVRRLLENAALLEVAAAGGEIVNGAGFPSGELWPE